MVVSAKTVAAKPVVDINLWSLFCPSSSLSAARTLRETFCEAELEFSSLSQAKTCLVWEDCRRSEDEVFWREANKNVAPDMFKPLTRLVLLLHTSSFWYPISSASPLALFGELGEFFFSFVGFVFVVFVARRVRRVCRLFVFLSLARRFQKYPSG